MAFDPPDLPDDPDEVTDRILDGLADRLDLDPVDGDPLIVLAEEIGREAAATNAIANEFIDLAVAGFGQTGFGFAAYLGSPASVSVDLEISNPGSTVAVPAGFTVVGTNPAGEDVAFVLLQDTTAPTDPTPVILAAAETGTEGNGVPAGPLTVVTATTNVVDAAATSPSAGGADPEALADYLDRLVDYLETLRPGGVRADDLASLARSVPGVARALGVDLYDPANPGTPAERTATVFPVDAAGLYVPAGVRTQVQALLAQSREVNFVINVASPTYTAVHVQYTGVADRGVDPDAVETAINAAVTAWLATWGTSSDDDTQWVSTPVVYHLELARVASSVDGLDHLTALTINGSAANLPLPGPAPLPTPPTAGTGPSTCSGTITAP